MNILKFIICFSLLFESMSCYNKNNIHQEKAFASESKANVNLDTAVIYVGNFSTLLNKICNFDSIKLHVIQKPYEVTIKLDSFGQHSFQVYRSHNIDGKKNDLTIERIYRASKTQYYNNCASFFKRGKTFEKFPVYCTKEFIAKEDAFITYNKDQYFYLQSIIPESCVGSGCRYHDYPVFFIKGSNIDLYVFHEEDDIAGLRTLDLNRDKHLDFLELSHEFTNNELKKLNLGRKEGMNNYKIRVVSYIDGKWQYLKDNSGIEYYIVVQLEKGLNLNSPYKIFATNWPEL